MTRLPSPPLMFTWPMSSLRDLCNLFLALADLTLAYYNNESHIYQRRRNTSSRFPTMCPCDRFLRTATQAANSILKHDIRPFPHHLKSTHSFVLLSIADHKPGTNSRGTYLTYSNRPGHLVFLSSLSPYLAGIPGPLPYPSPVPGLDCPSPSYFSLIQPFWLSLCVHFGLLAAAPASPLPSRSPITSVWSYLPLPNVLASGSLSYTSTISLLLTLPETVMFHFPF